MKIIHFYHFDSDPRFPPFLLYVRWKSGVTFVKRCFGDEFSSWFDYFYSNSISISFKLINHFIGKLVKLQFQHQYCHVLWDTSSILIAESENLF